MRRSSACIHAPTISTAASKSCVLTVLFESTFLPSYCPFISHPASRSIDWVQDTVTATTKWGAIGDLDVSGVTDFSYAFSTDRNAVGGKRANNGNRKALIFAGTDLSKWNTASATTMVYTFKGAAEMNADVSGWKVAKVTSLSGMFNGASKFTGTGVDAWNVAKVATMSNTFDFTPSLTPCNKRKIADAWKSSSVFVATTYDTDWATDTCTVRFE